MRHFIYQDEKSHKFWAVEQQGNGVAYQLGEKLVPKGKAR